MASQPAERIQSLAQVVDEENLDGKLTFEEALCCVDGMKLVTQTRPIVVNKPAGTCTIADMPVKGMLSSEGTKKRSQFLDVIMDYKGALDLKLIEDMFVQQRYADLPAPISLKSTSMAPYTTQLFILPNNKGTNDIVKHVRFDGATRVLDSTIHTMCQGQGFEIEYNKHCREGTKALQYMLEQLGGFQVKYNSLVPAGGGNKIPKEEADLQSGFDFIRAHGPSDSADAKFIIWTEIQINKNTSPIYGWDKGLVKETLRSLAEGGHLAKTIENWPLTLKSFKPWVLNTIVFPLLSFLVEHGVVWLGKAGVGKSPLAYTISTLMSAFWILQGEHKDKKPSFQVANHLDYFRGERGCRAKPRVFDDGNLNFELPAAVKALLEVSGPDRMTMARYTASKYEMNQLCQACANPFDPSVLPLMTTSVDEVESAVFLDLVRPAFHEKFGKEDIVAVMKRSVFVVLTEDGVLFRPPGQQQVPVKRHAWPDGDDKGMVSHCARPALGAYKTGQISLPDEFDRDMQWSLNYLQAALDARELTACQSIQGETLDGKTFVKESRPALDGISGDTVYFSDDVIMPSASRKASTSELKRVASSASLMASSQGSEQDGQEMSQRRRLRAKTSDPLPVRAGECQGSASASASCSSASHAEANEEDVFGHGTLG